MGLVLGFFLVFVFKLFLLGCLFFVGHVLFVLGAWGCLFFPDFEKKYHIKFVFSPLTLKSSNTSLKLQRKPRESDFETIKLISNGAYG